jgi:hypothetical protein
MLYIPVSWQLLTDQDWLDYFIAERNRRYWETQQKFFQQRASRRASGSY